MATADLGPILVVGCRGLLGRELMEILPSLGAVSGADLPELDIRSPASVAAVLAAHRPRWVVNAAAYTDVDRCETEREKAFAVNALGAGNLARACRKASAALVHLSTDFVFDGAKGSPYLEEDPPRPLSVYGESKLAGEEAVRAAGGRGLIVRTAWLFGRGGRNFPDTILARARETGKLAVVDDQEGSPTYAVDLARGIAALVRAGAEGTVHLSNRGHCSWFEYARFIVAVAGIPAEVRPAKSAELNRPARRPSWSVLSLQRYETLTGLTMRPWQEAVREYIMLRA